MDTKRCTFDVKTGNIERLDSMAKTLNLSKNRVINLLIKATDMDSERFLFVLKQDKRDFEDKRGTYDRAAKVVSKMSTAQLQQEIETRMSVAEIAEINTVNAALDSLDEEPEDPDPDPVEDINAFADHVSSLSTAEAHALLDTLWEEEVSKDKDLEVIEHCHYRENLEKTLGAIDWDKREADELAELEALRRKAYG